jgi:SAM-dependent methyltransferase
MAHKEQKDYCLLIKESFPTFFSNKKVLDCGSLDINGSNRYLFENCEYIGIDIGEGKNVDIVSLIHEFNGDDESYDTIISTECFEHDMYYKESIKNIIRLLKPGGLFIFTCATTGRPEHGTINTSITDSPLLKGEWSKYYKNLTEEDIRDIIIIENIFIDFKFSINKNHKDLFFYGIKK